ncbi:MAG: hypothetical protein P4M05_24065 [Bradyrhizobium sp.]|nr:hypothetical protein [Bradyrhizobium sp.]
MKIERPQKPSPELVKAVRDFNWEAAASWDEIGQYAFGALSVTRRGEREAIINQTAAHYGTYPNQIRKYAAAYAFTEKLEDQKLAGRLRQQPSGIVDVLGSWYEYDPVTALKRAEEVLAGQWSYRQLLAAVKQARQVSGATPEARARYWKALALAALLAGPCAGFQEFEPEPPYRNLPADLWLKRRSRTLAIRVLGPYPAPADYARNIYMNVAAAHGVAAFGFDAWIVMPENTAASRYLAAEKELAPPGAPVTIAEIPMPAPAKVGQKSKRKPA